MTQTRLARLSYLAIAFGLVLGLFGSWLTHDRPPAEVRPAPILSQPLAG